MRNVLLAFVAVSVGLSAGAVGAVTTEGSYVGTFAGNDPFNGSLFGSPSLYKCDEAEVGACKPEPGIVMENFADGDFTVSFAETNGDGEWTGGTWSFAPNAGETHTPVYLVLKAGPDYAVYDVSGLSPWTALAWSTDDHLGGKGISHISWYNAVVPLPAAGWLLISGVAGLVAAGARKRRAA